MGNPRDTCVYVVVDIFDLTNDNLDQKVKFYDNRVSKPGHGKKFKSKVNSGKKIHWTGIGWYSGENKTDVDVLVAITKISIQDIDYLESKILWRNEYLDNGTGEVIGAIKEKNTKDANGTITEKYNITIRVNNENYIIDPQLEMI